MNKFVKVRIAVAVDHSSGWNASGWREADREPPSDAEVMGLATDTVADSAARYWLEAELEVPEAKVVQAEVRNG